MVARVCILKPKRKRSEWRDAAVELPESNGSVLVEAKEHAEPLSGFFEGGSWYLYPSICPTYRFTVLRWRPMPRGPKAVAK